MCALPVVFAADTVKIHKNENGEQYEAKGQVQNADNAARHQCTGARRNGIYLNKRIVKACSPFIYSNILTIITLTAFWIESTITLYTSI
jgi:hypothetical protein